MFIKFSYSDGTSSEYLKRVDDVLKNLPVEVISDISEKGFEIRITDEENMGLSENQDKVILISEGSDKSQIRQEILQGYETASRKEEMEDGK